VEVEEVHLEVVDFNSLAAAVVVAVLYGELLLLPLVPLIP
jgi:hypothetical protein